MKREQLIIVLGLLLLSTAGLQADLSDGLVAYYPFAGSANDESGNGYYGTVSGATLTEDRFGDADSAYSFDGNDHIVADNFPDITESVTFAAWLYVGHTGGRVGGYVLNKGKYLVPETYSILVSESRLPQVRVHVNGGDYLIAESSQPLEFEDWTHVAGVFDRTASTLDLFIDGQSKDSQTASGALDQNSESLYFGSDHGNALTTWEGRIDEVHIYSRALTDAEVRELVPEPASLSLLALGWVVLVRRRKEMKTAIPRICLIVFGAVILFTVFAVPARADCSLGPWELQGSSMFATTHGFGAAAVGSYVYAFGGQAPGPYGNSVAQRYDPASDTWVEVASMPTARHSLKAVELDGYIYAIGGHVFNSRRENERYDPTTNSWQSLAAKPTAVSGLGVTAFGGKIYTFGGNRYGSWQSVIEVYDPGANTWRSAGNMPEAGEPWDAVAIGDRIYLAGGNGFASEGGTASHLWAYDPISGTWDTNLPTLNVARSSPELVSVNNTLFAIGGSSDGGPLSSVECWSPGDSSWTLCESLNVARVGHETAAIGQTIYAFGGYNSSYESSGNLPSIEAAVAGPPTPPVPPTAEAGGPYTIWMGDPLLLNANHSAQGDYAIVSYTWDLDSDGHFETDAGDQRFFEVGYGYVQGLGLTVGGLYEIHLQVADRTGLTDTASSTLRVVPEPATLSLLILGGPAVLRRRSRKAKTLVRRRPRSTAAVSLPTF